MVLALQHEHTVSRLLLRFTRIMASHGILDFYDFLDTVMRIEALGVF